MQSVSIKSETTFYSIFHNIAKKWWEEGVSEEGGHLIIQSKEALLNAGRLSTIDLLVPSSLDQLLL